MSSSDDTDSNSSFEISDDSDDTESNHSESEGEDTDHNDDDDQLSDITDRDGVSETVFLEGTESAINGKGNSV